MAAANFWLEKVVSHRIRQIHSQALEEAAAKVKKRERARFFPKGQNKQHSQCIFSRPPSLRLLPLAPLNTALKIEQRCRTRQCVRDKNMLKTCTPGAAALFSFPFLLNGSRASTLSILTPLHALSLPSPLPLLDGWANSGWHRGEDHDPTKEVQTPNMDRLVQNGCGASDFAALLSTMLALVASDPDAAKGHPSCCARARCRCSYC